MLFCVHTTILAQVRTILYCFLFVLSLEKYIIISQKNPQCILYTVRELSELEVSF